MSGKIGSAADLTSRLGEECVRLLMAGSESEFDEAFDVLLQQAVEGLEQDKRNFQRLGEDGLSSVLALSLKTFGLIPTRETNSNGHVDITIEIGICRPRRRLLCEAKIYDGYVYHIKGLEQLLGRYMTGREDGGLLFAYVRNKNIAGLIKELREQMDDKKPLDQTCDTENNPRIKWSFISKHRHSCGEELKIRHIGCNLCIS